MPPKSWNVGDELLGYFGTMIYKAKITKISKKDASKTRFHVHWPGWNKKWDTWLDESQLMDITPETEAKAVRVNAEERVREQLRNAAGSRAKGGKSKPVSRKKAEQIASEQKRKLEKAIQKGGKSAEKEGMAMRSAQLAREGIVMEKPDVQFRLNLPTILKIALVDDWERTTKRRYLIRLPKDGSPALKYCSTGLTHLEDRPAASGGAAFRSKSSSSGGSSSSTKNSKSSSSSSRSSAAASSSAAADQDGLPTDYFARGQRGWTVARILDEYVATKRREKADKPELLAAREITEGVKLYFDRALPVYLIYRFERQQFDEIEDTILNQQLETEPDIPWSEIYGMEHLLRLFTRLPRLIVVERLAASEQRQLQQRLADLVRFVARRFDEIGGGPDSSGPATREYADEFFRLMEHAAVLDRTIQMGLNAKLLEKSAAGAGAKARKAQARGAARAAARGSAEAGGSASSSSSSSSGAAASRKGSPKASKKSSGKASSAKSAGGKRSRAEISGGDSLADPDSGSDDDVVEVEGKQDGKASKAKSRAKGKGKGVSKGSLATGKKTPGKDAGKAASKSKAQPAKKRRT